jgi:hypothetical protein
MKATIDSILVEVSSKDRLLLEKIGRLRVRAWATEFPAIAQMECWLDRFDETAMHWAFLQDGEPIAAARMTVHQALSEVPESEVYEGLPQELAPAPIASINRLVVDPSSRGLGLSKRLDLVRLETADKLGCRCVVGDTHSQQRVQQLKKLGCKVIGRGKPHQEWAFVYGLVPWLLVCPLPGRLRKRPRFFHEETT